jgi:SAM-dependent methyltransferase
MEGMLAGVARRSRATSEIVIPAVPALLDHYVELLDGQFASLGRRFSEEDLVKLRGLLLRKLDEGFRVSPHSTVHVRYHTDPFPSVGISYAIAVAPSTVEQEYALWTTSRKAPLFGKHPDNKVMHLAEAMVSPERAPCLDIGAGTGRNTLPLARRGHPVDAIELSPALAAILERDAKTSGLSVRVLRGNILDDALELPQSHYSFVIAAELTSHFRGLDGLRRLCERLADALHEGGVALVQAFVMAENVIPDDVTRELSQVFWSTLYTYDDLREATRDLPLHLESDEAAVEYEQHHTPEAAWPPTAWYEGWASGHDLFGNYGVVAPMNLRWLVYRRDLRHSV